MDLKIGKVIFNLRKENRITQEQLANAVGVSIPAVSKWESGNAYPDITLLPSIARFFNITIDKLLDFSKEISEEEVMNISKECAAIFESKDFDKALSLCENYIKEYPNSYFLKFRIAHLYNVYFYISGIEEKMNATLDRAIQLFKETSLCDNLEIKHASLFSLSSLYSMTNKNDEAIEILKSFPRTDINPDIMLSTIYLKQEQLEDANELNQKILYKNIRDINMCLDGLCSIAKKNNDRNKLHFYLTKQRELIKTFYLENIFLANNSFNFAEFYAKEKALDTTLDYLEEYFDYLIKLNNASITLKSNKLFNTINLTNSVQSVDYIKSLCTQALQSNNLFDFIKSSDRYKNLIDKLMDISK